MAKKKASKAEKNCLFGLTQATSWPSKDNPFPEHEFLFCTSETDDVWAHVFGMPYRNRGALHEFGEVYSYWGCEPLGPGDEMPAQIEVS